MKVLMFNIRMVFIFIKCQKSLFSLPFFNRIIQFCIIQLILLKNKTLQNEFNFKMTNAKKRKTEDLFWYRNISFVNTRFFDNYMKYFYKLL